ncbi:MAG: hypothetical protein FWF41_08900 [Betaproteobacteria bacterium]|nr:hypothetical protein [Betaproteobacteria bacterium]
MRIVLISCVAKKRKSPSLARDMYISPLFKGAYQYAKKHLAADRVFILSAKYGLLEETDKIEPYNETLNTKPDSEIKEWAANVLMALSQKTDLQTDEFIFLAGKKYRKFLIEKSGKMKNTNNDHVSIPLEGLPIGKQLKFYKAHR